MYVKTQWVNNTTPINDTNLNKIEQGIYDNSLVVDAVTNTINPTDTETYKTAELTEGQITDVIGVSDILIKGDTEQDGTPTPSAPVDINVVSGSNVIGIYNKNIINVENFATTAYGITVTKKGNVWEINGTATANNTFKLIPIIQSTLSGQYALTANYISGTKSGTANFNLRDNTSDSALFNVNLTTSNTTNTATLNNKVKYGIYIASGATFNNYKFSPQLEVGGTATTYEPHQGKELPLDLSVENLLNLTDGTYTHNGITAIVTNRIITLNGTASGTSAINIPINLTIKANQSYTLEANNISIVGQSGTAASYACIRFRAETTDDAVSDVRFNPINNYTTFQKTEETTYDYLRIRTGDGLTYNNFIIKPQLEQGSKANAYTPYGTEPIELCKIGSYQDYFYKSGSKWYLHKEIEKLILGNYDWTLANNTSISNINTNRWHIAHSCSKLPNNNAKVIMSNILPMGTANSTYVQDALLIGQSATQTIIRMPVEYTTASAIKTALQNLSAYAYVLKNEVTDTEITDTILISQLEAIYNAPLYEQTNITQTNNDLPMILDITACKDNINGIKAFIRK